MTKTSSSHPDSLKNHSKPKIQANIKDLKELQKEWYSILEDDGFEDLETFDSNMNPKDMLRKTTSEPTWKKVIQRGNEQYYYIATIYTHEYPFKSKEHRYIWELHANGKSYNAILKLVPTHTYAQIRHIIEKVKKQMMKDTLTQNTIDRDKKEE